MPINATKPSVVPRWATDGGTRTEPLSGQKDTGYVFDDIPAAEEFNWLLGTNYDWQQYLEDATDELDAEKLERNGSNTVTGHILPDANGTRNLGATGTRFGSVYAASLFATAVHENLVPNATNTLDLGVTGTRWRHLYLSGNADIAGDISCDDIVADDITGDAASFATLQLSSTFLGPALVLNAAGTATTSIANTLTQRNTSKLWASVTTDGVGGVSLVDGFNVDASGTVSIGSSHITINIGANMASGAYAVFPHEISDVATTRVVQVVSKNAGSVVLVVREAASGTILDPASVQLAVDVEIMGIQ